MIHDQTIKLVDEYIAMCERNVKASGNPYPGYAKEVAGILDNLRESKAKMIQDRTPAPASVEALCLPRDGGVSSAPGACVGALVSSAHKKGALP
jgi:hypothetical protein